MVQWELVDQDGLALSSDDEIAGKGVMFVIVDDVSAERRRLQGMGIVLGEDIKGDYSTPLPGSPRRGARARTLRSKKIRENN